MGAKFLVGSNDGPNVAFLMHAVFLCELNEVFVMKLMMDQIRLLYTMLRIWN